jgi:hypothetical protein
VFVWEQREGRELNRNNTTATTQKSKTTNQNKTNQQTNSSTEMVKAHQHQQQHSRVVMAVVVVVAVAAAVAAAAFPADFSTDSIAQAEGVRLIGANANEYFGMGGSGGDLDGDGVADFVVGAHGAASLDEAGGGLYAGHVYVLYGMADPADAWTTDSEAKAIAQDSTMGRIIDGFNGDTFLGQVVAVVGDVNGDMYDDIAVSSYEWNSDQGKVWLVWGKPRAEATTPLYVNTLDASKFVEITGEASGNEFGRSIAGGDFNHDGISDLIIGAPGYSSGTGRSYIVWGYNGTWDDTINAADIGGVNDNGVMIIGEDDSWSGTSVANAGDVNHDGKTDLIIGAPDASPSGLTYAGRTYIVFGNGSGTWPATIDLGSLTAADGVIINGAAVDDYLGLSVSGNVDVNGDNTADVIVGAPGADPDSKDDAGITYVVFGSATLPATIDASDDMFFDGTNGFKLFGEMTDDWSGYFVSSAGDVNGDDIGDIIIGAPYWNLDGTTDDAGRSYVVFGHRSAWSAVMELSTLDGTNGFTISGNLLYEYSGYSVSGAGDINNDGLSDIIVGAYGWTSNRGRAVVVYGSCPTDHWIDGTGCKTCDPSCGNCDAVAKACTSCPEGHYIVGLGCNNCTMGGGCLTCNMTNGACTSCPLNNWIDGTGCKTCDPSCGNCDAVAGACTSCPEGQRIVGLGCNNCTLTGACAQCNAETGECNGCKAGHYLDGTTCEPCPALHFNTNETATECMPCDVSGACQACAADTGECSQCTNTSGLVGGHCEQCGAGQYSKPPGVSCEECLLGFGCLGCDVFSGMCNNCPAGKHVQQTRCKDCEAGKWSAGGNVEACTSCTLTDCTDCDPLSGKCASCPVHHGLSASGCVECGANEYSDGRHACGRCDLNGGCTACDGTSGACTACPGGHGVWGSGCVKCGAGEFVNPAKQCQPCPIFGKCEACDMASGTCSRCPRGWKPSGYTCVRGTASSDGSEEISAATSITTTAIIAVVVAAMHMF